MPSSQSSADAAEVRAGMRLLLLCHPPTPPPTTFSLSITTHASYHFRSQFAFRSLSAFSFLLQYISVFLSLGSCFSLLFQVLLTCIHSVSLADARVLSSEMAISGAAGDGQVQFPCPACGTICSKHRNYS
jgi:hypothetical protein